MPIEGYFRDEDGNEEEAPATYAGETFFLQSYDEDGGLCGIIGIECPGHDLGAVVHILSDEDKLETACPANLSELFTEETMVGWMVPDGEGIITFTNKAGQCIDFVMKHSLPFTKSLN